jgi:hypothetical protein
MKQQTAVDWLVEQIENGIFCDHIKGVEYWDKETLLEFFDQAKKVFCQQIEDAWDTAYQAGRFEGKGIAKQNWQTFDNYFTQTYEQ